MIYEYAIAPDFLFELADKRDLADRLLGAFGIGKACVLAGYPEDLGDIAYAKIEEEEACAKDQKLKAKLQIRKHKVIELATNLTRSGITKRYGAKKWEGAFVEEHRRLPFEGILFGDTTTFSDLPFRNLDWLRKDCPLFLHPGSVDSPRTAEELGATLAPLLRNASSLTFVDPYFFPKDRYKKSYRNYFETIDRANNVRAQDELREVLIICTRERPNKIEPIPHDEFRNVCLRELPRVIPEGLRIRIHCINNKDGGQRIHNRYVLSEIGGVFLGAGTDLAQHNDTSDDIAILGQSQVAKWNKAYTPGSGTFDWSEPPVIVGRQGVIAPGG